MVEKSFITFLENIPEFCYAGKSYEGNIHLFIPMRGKPTQGKPYFCFYLSQDWKAHICSENNFPTAAGLASSAAGYACLGKQHLGLRRIGTKSL